MPTKLGFGAPALLNSPSFVHIIIVAFDFLLQNLLLQMVETDKVILFCIYDKWYYTAFWLAQPEVRQCCAIGAWCLPL